MHPILFEIGNWPVYSYGVLLAAAYLSGLQLAVVRARRIGVDGARVMDLGIYLIIAALVGAKLMLVAVDFDYFRSQPREMLSLVRAGGVFYGGLILATVVGLLLVRRYKLPVWRVADVYAPGIALGHVVGRLGCLMAGCCYGRPTDEPWGITFTNPAAAANAGTPLGEPLHPTQLYDAGAELLILIFLLVFERRGKPFAGRTFWLYMLLYAISRFIVEIYRGDNRGTMAGMSTSQFVSLLVVPTAIVMLLRLRRAPAALTMTAAGSPRPAALTVTARDAGTRLDQFIRAHLTGLSRSQIQSLIRDGHVTLSEGHAKPALAVWEGLRVDVRLPEIRPATPAAEALPIALLYDDPDIAVVNKPAGMVVHPAAGHTSGTLVNALLHHLAGLSGIGGTERPGIVHRLDRGTSGVMVVAKNDRAHRALSQQFQERAIGKEYVTLVWGAPQAGEKVSRPIGRDPRHRQKMSSRAVRGRQAVTRILSVEPLGGVSLVRVAIDTGRTHQIRVHLSETGHPVVGDALYGGARKSVPPRLAAIARISRPFLHAARLTLAHPADGRTLSFEAPLPDELGRMLDALRRASGRPTGGGPEGTPRSIKESRDE